MQLKEVASLLGVENKEIIAELEARRAEFGAKGLSYAKKLNAASALDQELAKQVLASFDIRRQQTDQVEKELDEKRRRAEEERRREAERIQREKEEEERRAKAEANRAKMDAEIARRQAEVARQEEAARQAEAAAKKAEEEARAKEKAAAAAAERPAAPAPAPAPAPVVMPVAPAPVAPAAAAPAPPPATPAPTAPIARPATGEMHRPPAPGAPRMPSQRPGAPPHQGGPGGYPPRHSGPGGPGGRPQQGFDRGPGGPPRGPGGGYQPRDGQGQRPPFNREGGGPRPPYNREGGAPRPGGDRRGPGGPGGDRRPGGPGGDRRGPGGFQQRHDGTRPPRTGGPGGGPGAGREGFNRSGPGGDRRPGGGARPGGDGRPARSADLQSFVEQGLQSDVSDDFRRTQARRGAKPVKTGAEKEREKEGAWTEEGAAAKNRKGGKPPVDDGKKKIRPSQLFNVEGMNDRRSKPRKRSGSGADHRESATTEPSGPKAITFHGDFTVGEFATRSGIPLTDVMSKLFGMGRMMTINQLLDPDVAEELALEFEIEIVIQREGDEADIAEFIAQPDPPESLRPRPPIVTVMGHVDHGKTSLLDRIRKADVAAGEFGGITQHIGAYHVTTSKGDIVFLDTPGHEAFTEMRSRGANVTDLVVLVVAANDGVMPQTVEAISHAKAAKVQILVAINKVDVPGANIERVKQELMKYEMVAEEYGGDTIMIPVSALTGQNIDSLLEYIALQTEILELKANPDRAAIGTIVESHIDPLRGATATVLVQRGTLKIGDVFVCGTVHGRVRAMRDDHGKPLEEAPPATPVEILGLSGSPDAGEKFVVTNDEAEARTIAERRLQRRKKRKAVVKQHISLDNLAERIGEEDTLNLNIIVKADVQGSVEAISTALLKIKSDKVFIKILHAAVGAVSSSDVQLADASEAIVLAFNVGVDTSARNLGEELGVDIRKYQIIYALLEDIEKAMVGMLTPEFEEKEEGRAKVLQVFKVSKIGSIAGSFVEEGTVQNNHHARLLRDGAIIWRGKIKSLRRVKDDVKSVQAGLECGIGLEGYNDIKEGDTIEFYSMVEQAVSLVSSDGVAKT
ncbi:translation initiation factor IF-2 [Candidatus Sumerlaeota bacterium]|nr:translation initiation factor IF-2 [Candidatus Sumerlaeota bacterium]